MIDRKWIGHHLPPIDVAVERGRLRQFAKAIGEQRPEYIDPTAARVHGWTDLPVPPTLLFGLEMEQPNPWSYLTVVGVALNSVLHAQQSFSYARMAVAGDHLQFAATITDVEAKKGGQLDFLTKETTVSRHAHTADEGVPEFEHIASLRCVVVVRNPS
jgi:hypothetical protein